MNNRKVKGKNRGKGKEKETTIAQVPSSNGLSTNDSSSAKIIHQDYITSRQTFTSIFTDNIWQPNSNNLKQKIADLEKTVKDIYQASCAGSRIETVIMLKILEWRIITLSDHALTDKGITAASQALTLLRSSSQYKFFNNEPLFQQEVCHLLSYVSKLRTENNTLQDDLDRLELLKQGCELSKNWQPSLAKLTLLHLFYFTTAETHVRAIITPEDKPHCILTYQQVLSSLEAEIKKNPTDAALAINYARASQFAFDFETETSPSHQKNVTPDKPKQYLKYMKQSYEFFSKYFTRSIKHLRQSDPTSLHANAEPITLLLTIVEQFRAIILQFIDQTARVQKLNIELFDDFLFKLELELFDLDIDLQEIFNIFKLNDIFPEIESGKENYQSNDALKKLRAINKKNQSRHELKVTEQLEHDRKIANEHAKSLGWDENEPQHKLSDKISFCVKQRLSNKTSSSSTAKKPLKSSDNVVRYLSRAQYYSRNRRLADAIDMYNNAFEEAGKQNDSYVQLLAREGQLLSYGRTTLNKVKKLHSTLYKRLRNPKTLPPEQLEIILNLVKETVEDHEKLAHLNIEYNKTVGSTNLNNNRDAREGFAFTQAYLHELLLEIGNLIETNSMLITTLNQQLKSNRQLYVFGLGMAECKRLGITPAPTKIEELGERIFSDIGIQKRLNNEVISRKTKERRAFNTVGEKIALIKEKHSQLIQQNHLNNEMQATLTPEMKQAAAELPAGIKYKFVGSCVMAEVCKKYKLKPINPRDIDIEVTCEDPNILIQAGFTPSPYNAYLYQKFLPQKLDIMLEKPSGPKQRDFTICAVYIEDGIFKDPTGTGIDDIINRRLRMIGTATTRLHEDPTRVLRAIYFMLKYDFQPDNALNEALSSMWIPDEHHLPHLLAKAKDHLGSIDRKKYIELLSKYCLLEKLFNIKSKNIDVALRQLEDLVGIKATNSQTKANLFSHTDDIVSRKKDKDNRSDMMKALNLA